MANTKAGGVKGAATKAANARVARGRIKRDEGGFTSGERLFVLHYMGAGNRSIGQSALLAGYGKGNLRTAQKYGSDLMRGAHVVAEIDRLTEQRNARLMVTADDVLRDLVILRADAEFLPTGVQQIRARREILKDIGDHVAVGAFRRNVGLSSPSGGPIEHVDLAALADLTDEELTQLERAREIMDRVAGRARALPNGSADQGGAGEAPEA
jgi:hypothetical protein